MIKEGDISGVIDGNAISYSTAKFEQDGPFIGITYVWPFASEGWSNGALSVDLGIAMLRGDLSTKQSQETTITAIFEGFEQMQTGIEDSRSDVSGGALGLNFGMAWIGAITDRLNYSAGLDGYQYNYEGDSSDADFRDSVLRFSVGVSYAIDAGLLR